MPKDPKRAAKFRRLRANGKTSAVWNGATMLLLFPFLVFFGIIELLDGSFAGFIGLFVFAALWLVFCVAVIRWGKSP